jgi:hypothetical protein
MSKVTDAVARGSGVAVAAGVGVAPGVGVPVAIAVLVGSGFGLPSPPPEPHPWARASARIVSAIVIRGIIRAITVDVRIFRAILQCGNGFTIVTVQP